MISIQDPARLMNPQYAALRRLLAARGVSPADPETQSLALARQAALSFHALWNEMPPPVARIAERTVAGPAGAVGVRLYWPDERPRAPVVLYFHGGGYVLNNLDTHDRLMRQLALYSGAVVVGVDYSLAPEARYPTQLNEALAVVDWLAAEGDALGLDVGRLVLAGDSAGANLALATLLALRNVGRDQAKAGLLFYGMYAVDFDTESHRRFGGGAFGLTTGRMRFFWDQYLRETADRSDPLAAPLHADLSDLPPLLLVGAGLDCLLDDTLRLAVALNEADVPHQLAVYPGVPHSFVQMSRFLDAADAVLRCAGAFVQDRVVKEERAEAA
ncbi:MAG TPA: alpha/beta hydrolase fold domain-containing protein [Azospirillaceae bacterium]|nr:alpha/beta hydrolase fold domain-containing protein [Azospirillaceae bacterium]